MDSLFENKIAQLQSEIELAKSNLVKNLSELSLTNYILDSSNLESIIATSLQNPGKIIKTIDSISKLSLDEENIIRKGTKYANLLVRAAEILTEE